MKTDNMQSPLYLMNTQTNKHAGRGSTSSVLKKQALHYIVQAGVEVRLT